ncbi:hypothetical protein V5E97_17365 [Singulisphaera sp. Ch08]|uniref:Uncharacterized protein n=1 Tax=Singulisphaera sp. Ch08 TaxID=3120278 RepID=A0AAU7CR96_9BACT
MVGIKDLARHLRQPSVRSLMLLVVLVAVSIVAVPKGLELKRARDHYLQRYRSNMLTAQHVRNSRNRESDPALKEWASVMERYYLTAAERFHLAAAKPWQESPIIPVVPITTGEQWKALSRRRLEIEQGSKPQILIDELIRPRGGIPKKKF